MKILPMYPSLQLHGTAALVAIELLRDTLNSYKYQPARTEAAAGCTKFFCNAIRKVYDADPELYAGVSVHDLRCWVQDCVDVLLAQQTGLHINYKLGYTLHTTLSTISQAQQVQFHNTADSYGQFAHLFFAELIDHAEACRLVGV